MTKKRKFRKYYTFAGTKWRYDKENHEHYFEYVYNGFLRADDRHNTKIRPEDLPASFVYFANSTRFNGLVDSAGVVDMKYVPNLWINHFLRDDYIIISYRGKIEEEKDFNYANEDFRIFGNDLLDFLAAAHIYSGYDISEIKQGIKEKLKILKEKHPVEFGNCNFDVDGWFNEADFHLFWNKRQAYQMENWIRSCCGLPEYPLPEVPKEMKEKLFPKELDHSTSAA